MKKTETVSVSQSYLLYLKIVRTMKLTIALMLLAFLQVSASGWSQERMTLKLTDVEIKKALQEIEKNSNYRFLFTNDAVKGKPRISLDVQKATVNEVLDKMLANTGVVYKVLGSYLIVLKEGINAEEIESKELRVTGKITSDNGEPLVGASVSIKGTRRGTATDASGNFAITVPDDAVLVISFVGFEDREIAVAGKASINVSLEPSNKKIDEVVVIGYGSASKRDLTGSIVKISGKDVIDRPNTNPVASLQGKVAGLNVVNNGTPGKSPDIRIRGTISIGSVKPLYVVDGIFNDNIDYINPNDIESIEILKDPSSLAIFGVKGAAGVIAVTTKRAKSGQTIINLSSNIGFKRMVDKYRLANASEFQEMFEEEKANIGVVDVFDYKKWPYNTDWMQAVTRVGGFNATNLSISSSSEKNKLNFGLGYAEDEGLVLNQKLRKYTLSFNDEVKLSKAIKLGFNFNGIRQQAPYGYAADVLADARKVVPITPSGTRNFRTKNAYGVDSLNYNMHYLLPSIQGAGVVNPLVRLQNEWNKTTDEEYRIVGSVFAEINFAKNFTFKSTYYADISNRNVREYTPLYYGFDLNHPRDTALLVNTLTSVREKEYTYRKFQQDYVLTYKKIFDKHSINATVGWTTYYFGNFNRFGYVEQSPTGLPIPDNKRFWYIDNGFGLVTSQSATPPNGETRQREYTTASALVRGLYNYNGKYYFSASYRKDGSSQISPENRWQDFWAIGAAWEMTRENFMSNQKIFDFVKVKASIGVLGNQNTYGYDYPFYPGLISDKVAVFSASNIFPTSTQAYLPSPNLRWETVHAQEIGVEADLLNRKLHLDISYFNKTTKDLMTFIPGLNGAQNGLDNIGKIKNSGIEFSATWSQQLSKDFYIAVNGNLTTYKNEVLDLATKDFAIISGNSRTIIGSPIGSFWGLTVDGIWQSNSQILQSPLTYNLNAPGPFPGDFIYRDLNGDNIIDTKDFSVIGNPTPDFTYGGSVSVSYKGQLDFSADFGGVYGNEVFRNYGNTEATFQRVNYVGFRTGRWHGAGTSNWEPILAQDHRNNYQASTYNIEDGSYFRIRNLQLGYNVPYTWLKTAKIKAARLFVNVQNLKTFKRNYGFTPEFGGDALQFGVDDGGGAIPMVTSFGINITF